nr:DUF2784 domain-containing protein [Desulfobacterales bacterium]
MLYHLLADTVVVFHFAFVLFVVLGGIISIWWRRVVWLHVPAALWSAVVEFTGWICPLTPLENWLRFTGEEPGYSRGFVEEYILPILYPAGLTRETQIGSGTFVVTVNILIYWYLYMASNSRPPNGKEVEEDM